MSSGGKSGSAQSQSKNIYGTIIGAVSWGPWDWVSAIIHNGSYLFQGDLALTTDVTDVTGAIADPTYLKPGGSLKIFRGTETQPADVTGKHRKGTVLIEANGIFFGQDTGTAPNLQVIGGAIPRVPTSIVAASDNVADDGQINPVAAIAEAILDERGWGKQLADLDGPSWLEAGHWAYVNRDYTFCSPLVTEALSLRELVDQLLGPFNGFLFRTRTGKIGCKIYEWGVDPGGLPVLDARVWTQRPRFPLGDWDEVPTEVVLSFTNRDFEHQSDSEKVPNPRAYQVRQIDDPHSLNRPHITRRPQVHRNGVEYIRRKGTAPTKAMVQVRAPYIASLDLLVGSKVRVDVDPEPGGAGLSQLCRIDKIEQDDSDEAKLTVVTDNLVPATAYTPSWTPSIPVDEVSPPLVNFIGVPLPPNAFGWPPCVALLAARPDPKIVGFEVYFGASHAGAFADLGQQAGFSVRAQLYADALAGAGTMKFTELDGLSAPDASLAANTPGGNATAAQDNILLALLAQLDGNGRIALGGDGDPIMEFVSIVDRAAVAGATFDYTVLRGRLGTTARDWTAGAVVWIVPRVNLTGWRHTLLSSMLGGVAYFRLVSFTQHATDESTPIPECSVNMLPATAPMYGGNIDNDVSPDEGVAPNPVSGVTVTSGVEQLILRWTNPTNVPLRRIFIRESDDLTRPSLPQFVLEPGQTFLFRTGLVDGSTKKYWIEVQGVNGRKTDAGPFSGTVVVWPVVSGINATIAAETAARILADNTEVTLRTNADNGLAANISSEATARAAADGTLTTNLATEVSARAAGDTALAAAVTTESTARAAADGSLAAEYVLTVSTGGASGRRIAGFRVTNLGGAGGATEFIIQADKFAIVNEDGDNQKAPFAVVGGEVFMNMAFIRAASITNAMINDLLADKVTAGTLAAMILQAAKTASDSVVFNPGYGVGSTFPAVCAMAGDDPSNNHAIVATTEYIVLGTVYGWATGSGFATDRFGKSDMVFMGGFYSAWTISNLGAGLSHADMYGVWRVNGGSWNRMTPQTRIVDQGNPAASVFGIAAISGLAGTDVIEFGVELVTPASQMYNYSTLSLSWGNL